MLKRHGDCTVPWITDSYGGVFVYNREEEILEQYDLEVRSTAKGRGALICDTDKGTFRLKPFCGSTQRADFLAEVLQYIEGQGFLCETVFPTKEGETLAKEEISGSSYILRTWHPGRECDVKNREEILTAVRRLAGYHNLIGCYQGAIPPPLQSDRMELLEEYRKHNRELNKVKNYIRRKRKKNDFERLFMEVYDSYRNQAEQITGLLDTWTQSIEPVVEQKICGLCHGDYNQHNVVFSHGAAILINFDQMHQDVCIMDLANFIRKILEKYNWNTGLGMDMVNVYDKIRPMLPEERSQLYLRLAYPKKYWKLANHYYNSNKAWVSGRNIEKLQKIAAQEVQRKQFLKVLCHFCDSAV